MKDIKVKSPNGEILNVSERAFKLLYGPVHGYKIYEEAEDQKKKVERLKR